RLGTYRVSAHWTQNVCRPSQTSTTVDEFSRFLLRAAQLNGTLQSIGPVDTRDGIAFVGTPTGNTVVANDVLRDHSILHVQLRRWSQNAEGLGPNGLLRRRPRARAITNFFNGHGTNICSS